MKIVSYNIQYSKGLDGAFDLGRVAKAVGDADIICLQEVVRNLPGVPDADQPARLSQLLPQYYIAFGAALDIDGGSSIVDGRAVSKRIEFGNMILSRWPIISTRNFILPGSGLYEDSDMQNCALEAVVDTPDGLLRVYSTHLNYRRSSVRAQQLEWLVPKTFAIASEGLGVSGQAIDASVGGEDWDGITMPPSPQDFVVCGDFNLTPKCREYETIVGEEDYFYGRRVSHDRWVDSWVRAGHDESNSSTWADSQNQNPLRLDYGFVSPSLVSKVKRAWIDQECVASDHKPYWFELT